MEENEVKKGSKNIFLIVSIIFVFAILVAVSIWIYLKPYVYVSLDVNPSISFSVNKFGRVIKVEALNDDGESILKEIKLNVMNENIEEALETSIDRFIVEGYISKDYEVNVLVSAYSEDARDADSLIKQLKLMIIHKIEDEGFVANVEGMSVDRQVFDDSKDLGVTPGKLDLINNIVDNNGNPSNDKIEDWIEKPLNEIISSSNEVSESEFEDDSDEHSGNRHGQESQDEDSENEIDD